MLNTSHYTLAVDALAVMVDQAPATPYQVNIQSQAGAECLASGSSRLVLIRNTGRNFYRYAYEIEIDGKPYGTLHLQSLRGESALMKVTIYNHRLYADYLAPFRQLLNDFQLRINNINKLDIAADTNKNIIIWFLNYFDQPELYEYRVNQRSQESIRSFATEYRNGQVNKTLYPYRVEDKVFRMYNKSQEIRDNGNVKAYIKEYHNANGLNTDQDVYRAELSLGNSILETQDTVFQEKNTSAIITEHKYHKLPEADKRYYRQSTQTTNAVDLFQLMESDYLASIFNRFAGKLIEFRMYDNDRVTRRTRVPFFELSNPRPLVTNSMLALPGRYQQRNLIHSLKQLVQQSYALALPGLLSSAQELAATSGLSERLAGFIELYKPRLMAPSLNTAPVNSTFPL